MIRPDVLRPLPSQLTSVVGAVVGTLLFTALLNIAPLTGGEFVDIPRLIGGIFSTDAAAVFWIGYILFLFIGMALLPPAIIQLWPTLPGDPFYLGGVALKGAIIGLTLWLLSGLLLPLLQVFSSGAGHSGYGFFAVEAGIGSALWFVVPHLGYGLALAFIAAMTHGIKPIDTLGWDGHYHGDIREVALGREEPIAAGVKISTKPW